MADEQDTQSNRPKLQVQQQGVAEKFAQKMQKMAQDTTEQLAAQKAASLGLEYIDLRRFPVSPEALKMIDEANAKEMQVVAFYRDPDSFRIAAVNPDAPEIKELLYQLEERHHSKGGMYVMSAQSLEKVLVLYNTIPKIKEVSHDVKIDEDMMKRFREEITSFEKLQGKVNEVNVTDFVAVVLASAVNMNASDVHIEAEKDGIAVRLRLDGILQEAATVERERWHRIVSRIKLLSGLKINITDKPQDGRYTILIDGQEIDVRVSTIPTAFGESVVMRLLRPLTEGMALESMGVTDQALVNLQTAVARPNGMIITTGPTGSGKTTTLYTILRHLNQPDVKIITLEDPIEYKLEGISQSQIDGTQGYTFAKGLRSILRQDPDIVLVGEIRDLETAEIAIQASLTGHLLLSTIHTNSAPGAIARFVSMGVKSFLLSPALNLIMGQRLVRRLCEQCKQPTTPTPEQLEKVNQMISEINPASGVQVDIDGATWFTSTEKGCETCDGIGYKGRMGIFEVMVMSDAVKDAITNNDVAEHHLMQIAIADGMVPMVTDGVVKASKGITSLDEVFRVAV